MIVKTLAPSNIALIKYMGKTSSTGNVPTNASLSFTLDHLVSWVEIEYSPGADQWKWEPLPETKPFEMSDKGRTKFIGFAQRLADQFRLPGQYLVRSGNSFPAACGIASSASSFAALTKAMCQLQQQVNGASVPLSEQSRLSRLGSGSSCRSLFGPWAIWKTDGAEPLELPISNLLHDVIIVDESEKQVSSSEAHLRVSSSLLFEGRPARAERRLRELLESLRLQDWRRSCSLVWEEFWDMHALFETSRPAFGYISERSVAVLNMTRRLWSQKKDGPMVTMDAGPNVHLLWRPDQTAMRAQLKEELRAHQFSILGS